MRIRRFLGAFGPVDDRMRLRAKPHLEKALAEAEDNLRRWTRTVHALREALELTADGHRPEIAPDFARMSAPEAAESILREAGRPLHYHEIVRRMGERGFSIKNPDIAAASLYGNMFRQPKRFVKLGRGLFTLAEQPLAPEVNGFSDTPGANCVDLSTRLGEIKTALEDSRAPSQPASDPRNAACS